MEESSSSPRKVLKHYDTTADMTTDTDRQHDDINDDGINVIEMDDGRTKHTKKTTSHYMRVSQRDTALQQITSKPFVLLCVFFAIQLGINNWNLATQRNFLAALGDNDHENWYLTIFTLLTPLSIFGAPAIDFIILNFGWTAAFQTINLLSVSFMIIKVTTKSLNVQIVGFVFYSFYRSFLFGISFSFLPKLIGKKFVGVAAGTMACCGGIMNLLLMPWVNVAVEDFFLPNMVFLLLEIPTIVIVCQLGCCLQIESEAKEIEEQEEGEATKEVLAADDDVCISDSGLKNEADDTTEIVKTHETLVEQGSNPCTAKESDEEVCVAEA